MNYWSAILGRVVTEQDYANAMSSLVQSAAPPDANSARVTFAFADANTRYELRYGGSAAGPQRLPDQCAQLAQELRVNRYQTDGRAALFTHLTIGTDGAATLTFDDGESGPVKSPLLFDGGSYAADLRTYPRDAPLWLTEYSTGTDLADLTAASPQAAETAEVAGSTDAQNARDSLWRSVGYIHPDRLTTSGDWAGTPKAYRLVGRNQTTILATDAMSAPSRYPGGLMTGVGAELFIEVGETLFLGASDPAALAKGHWLFGILAAVADRVAMAGAAGVSHVVSTEIPTYLEVGGVAGPPDWVVNGHIGVLLSTRSPSAAANFPTPLGTVALITVTLLRPSESMAVRSNASAAGRIANALNASSSAHYFLVHRPAVA